MKIIGSNTLNYSEKDLIQMFLQWNNLRFIGVRCGECGKIANVFHDRIRYDCICKNPVYLTNMPVDIKTKPPVILEVHPHPDLGPSKNKIAKAKKKSESMMR